jgi:hypothetical protein
MTRTVKLLAVGMLLTLCLPFVVLGALAELAVLGLVVGWEIAAYLLGQLSWP